MDTVSLLMIEHASLRVHFGYVRHGKADSIVMMNLEDFVRNCHAKIEDGLVFPKLKQSFEATQNQEGLKSLSRLESDHLLIDKIGEDMSQKRQAGDVLTLEKRVKLFADTVEQHNFLEEVLLFPHWKPDHEIDALAQEKIKAFGLDKYSKITGISEKLLTS